MLKPSRQPYGFKNLLAYKKAEELQKECSLLTSPFPPRKTLYSLSDQMNRSARSTKQNIVEGWKRNSTQEYYEFLGFSIGALTELEEDCNDIWNGIYPELMGIKGIMGERGTEMGVKGITGERRLKKGVTGEAPSAPSAPSTPSALSAPSTLSTPPTHSTLSTPPAHSTLSTPPTHSTLSTPLNPTPFAPLSPLNPFPPFDIEKLPFYPLDKSLPPIIQLKLRCKELNYLLNQLQKSLEQKMEEEKTLSASDRARKILQAEKQNQKSNADFLAEHGFVKLETGQVVSKRDNGE